MQFTKEELAILIEAMSTRVKAHTVAEAAMGEAPAEIKQKIKESRKSALALHSRFVLELESL